MNYPPTFSAILSRLNKLSFQAMGYSSPNPPVACVITDMNGNILGEGSTQKTGGNHAEREAYQHFAQKYSDAKNIPHLVFVTLEPCTHVGKTPPCIDLILEYKPVCVYYGLSDSNPLVKRRDGKKECELFGIKIIQSPEIANVSLAYLTGFNSRMQKNRPQIFIKSALSKEGFYADLEKTRIHLSNSYSNEVTQMLRSKIDAVIVGPATAYVDYPGLDFRGFQSSTIKFELREKKEFLYQNPKRIFTETLFINTFDIFSKEFLNSKIIDYQPYRIFVLSLKRIPDLLFFQKQLLLSEKYGKERTLFFLLDFDENNSSHQKLSLKMKEISSHELTIVKERSYLYDQLVSKFSEIPLNTVLVEGGNLLYKIFSDQLKEEDLIYIIRSKKEITQGIFPEMNLEKRNKIIEIQIDTDHWEIYGG